MVLIEDCVLIGDRYYLKEDVYKVFDTRIEHVLPEDLP
jgi:hypothetical protein